MGRLTSAFALEVFERKNARSPQLPSFLSIYVRDFGPEHRTQSNELVEFLEKPLDDRQIIYFGLTYNNEPCGFATFMYFPEGMLAIVDHLVISPNMRGYGAFFSFCDLIAGYIESKGLAVDYVVAEVMLDDQHMASTIKPTLLLRLMRLVGFRIAKVKYWAPDPGIVSNPNRCIAALLFASMPEREELSTVEFLRVVDLIYRSHYARWYRRTMQGSDFLRYEAAAERLLSQIHQTVGHEKRVVLNGMKNLNFSFTLDPNPPANPSALIYMGLLAIPAAVSVMVGFVQERRIALMATIGTVALLLIFAFHPRLRRSLLRAFRLIE